MKINKMVFMCIIILFIGTNGYGLSSSGLIELVNEFFKKNTSLKGNFEMYDGRQFSSGYFLFKVPQYYKMVFSHIKGNEIHKKRIITDGKTLWMYLPHLKLVIDQDLKGLSPVQISTTMLGIRRLVKHYHYKFEGNNPNLHFVRGLKVKVYALELQAKDDRMGFKKIVFYIRKDGCIVKTTAITRKNKIITLIRKNIVLNAKIEDKEFRREVPRKAKVIKNPFLSG